MTHEIDHLFICTSRGAPEGDQLVKLGLTEGSPNVHQGQGTANRRFFFHNAMLELLWVTDSDEVRSDMVRPTKLWDRWVGRDRDCSPFGVCLRPSTAGNDQPPFPTWEYRPPYLPEGLAIHIGKDTPLAEPLWFFLGFGVRPDAVASNRREPVEHPIGVCELTGVRIVTARLQVKSATARTVVQTGLVCMTPGHTHLIELTFDRHRGRQQQDFRPDLPLVVRW